MESSRSDIDVIALQRIHHHPETAAYYQRLLTTGKPPEKRPLRQARSRPPLLPRTSHDTDTRLDNIEASESRAAPS
jgi:hypothetical protein